MTELNKELQKIQKLIDSDASYDNHYLVHNNKVRLLISTIESLSEQNKEQSKELERLKVAIYVHESYDKTVSELHEENVQLRNQLREAVDVMRDINYQIGQSNHPASLGIAVAINQYLKSLDFHIQGKENPDVHNSQR